MNRSRAIAAGTSVGALVALTAGVAVANPGSHTTPPRAASDSGSRVQQPSTDDGATTDGDDSGWWGRDDRGSTDPGSGWSQAQPGPGSFDPGTSVGSGNSTRSGGS
jgi:hypothetical protein